MTSSYSQGVEETPRGSNITGFKDVSVIRHPSIDINIHKSFEAETRNADTLKKGESSLVKVNLLQIESGQKVVMNNKIQITLPAFYDSLSTKRQDTQGPSPQTASQIFKDTERTTGNMQEFTS